MFYIAQLQLTNFQKFRNIDMERKTIPVADSLARSFTWKELQLNEVKQTFMSAIYFCNTDSLQTNETSALVS